MKGLRRAVATLAACAGSLASAQTIVSYSIDGPDQINAMAQLNASYAVTAHLSDGTAQPAPAGSGYLDSSDATVLAGPAGTGGLSSSTFIPAGLGTANVQFHSYSAQVPSVAKAVSVVNGADVSGAVTFDCASEPAGPSQNYYPSALYLPQSWDMIALCNGQVLVANARLSRIQAIDTTTGQILRNWPLRADPRNIVRVPGTQIVFAALGDGTVARLDASTGAVAYTPLWLRPVWAVAAFESGQVVAVSSEYPSGSDTLADATVIDVATMATRTVTLNVPISVATPTPLMLTHDATHHALFYSHRYGPWLARFPYDVSTGTFGAGTFGAMGASVDLALSPDAGHVLNVGTNYPNGGSAADALIDFSTDNFPDELGYFNTEFGASSADFGHDDSQLLVATASRMLLFDRPTRKVVAAWSLSAQCSSNYPARARRSVRGRYAEFIASCGGGSLPAYSVIQWVQVLDPADPLPPALATSTYTIDGPDTIDASVSTSATYQVMQSVGGTAVATGSSPETASNQILAQVGSPATNYVANGLGTVQLTWANPTVVASRLVRVVSGSGAADPLSLDCSADASDPAIAGLRAHLLLAEVVEIAPLCHGQVLVASAGLNRLQAIDVASGRILRNWLLPASPVAMVRLPGTNTAVVSLDSDQLARVDLVTGQVDVAAVPHAPQVLLAYEPGQLLGIAQYFVPPGTHKTDAYVVDAASLAPTSVGWPAQLNSLSKPTARYETTRHRLYFYYPETYSIAQLTYDAPSASFVVAAQTPSLNSSAGFAVSPDGSRLAYGDVSPANGQQSLLDVSTSPFGSVQGVYYPGSFSLEEFTQDGAQLAASAGYNLVRFDAATHAALGGFPLDIFPGCSGEDRLRWSSSGRYTFATRLCFPSYASQVDVFDWSSGGVRATPFVSVSQAGGPTPPLAGDTVTFLASVSANNGGLQPTGTVTFNDGGSPIAGCVGLPASGLQTACSTSFSAGQHTITVSYSGDALYTSGVSAPWPVSIFMAPSIALTSSPNPSGNGTSVTFTVKVSGSGGTPTGTVYVFDGPSTVCYGLWLDATGTATCSTSSLSAGTHSITATYSGDTAYARATSAALTQTVQSGLPGETNVALASSGAIASASSQYGAGFPIAAINDGAATGASWSNGGGWADGTVNAYPDWVQIDFPAPKLLDKVVVYTLQDNWQNPAQPTDTMTFSQYGIVDFTVQGWDGAQWQTLATVTGNNLVKRTITFAAFNTTKIRVNVTKAMNSLSRITEIEAWGVPGTALPPPSGTNVALASSGATASASSQYSAGFPVAAVIDGDETGANWSNGGGWADGTVNQYPDWVEVDFAQASQIDHVVVTTLQDNWQSPSQPTDTMTFTQYGITAFDVQAWNGSAWQTVGSVTNNNLVKRTVSFPAVTTSKIRIVVNAALNSLSRITEIEAFVGSGGLFYDPHLNNVALARAGAVVSASSQLSTAFPAQAVIDGDPTGAGWSNGGGWADGTPGQFPDWVQVSMPARQWVSQVVVYTLQDNWQNPVQPTDTMTFTQYGITDFDVQSWDGTQWVTLASVTGNNLVKRTVSFNAVATTQIRVLVKNALNTYSRITEIEVWGTPVSTTPTGTNWAAASNGGVALASSQYSAGFPVAAVIDGERKGTNWSAGGGWADATPDKYPDWVEVDLSARKTLNMVIVYTLQDNWQSPSEPTDTMTFTQYGVTDFQVQIWDGSQWITVGTISNNHLVKRSVAINVSTSKIRINVTGAKSSLSRITEIEAYGN